MDQPLKSPGQSALRGAFHRLFEFSRTMPALSLGQRLDRLARLHAAGRRAAGKVDAVFVMMFRPSFRGDAKHRTRNLGIPGLVLRTIPE
jgi:hypothetical protein